MAVTVAIPVDLRSPRIQTLAGNAFWTVSGMSTTSDLGHWEFLQNVDGKVYGEVKVPPNMAATPNVYFEAWISHANGTTGEVTSLQVNYLHRSTGESLTTAFTTSTVRDFTVSNTADVIELVRLPESGFITAPVAGDITFVEFFHDGDKPADTLSENTRLHRLDMIIDLA